MKELEKITDELKGIRNILASIWHSRYANEETDLVSPQVYSDEYISTEECAKRLSVTDQTVRNWILQGKRPGSRGWVQGVHYINIPSGPTKNIIRIPWNQLILSYHKGDEINLRSFDKSNSRLYKEKRKNIDHVPDPSYPNE